MADIELSNLTKVYDPGGESIAAVEDLNLHIKDGEFLVLVGPSGCGKSTTLRMIAGLEEVTGGTIKINDKVVNDLEPKERNIAMVFQNYALYPHKTVRENIGFPLKYTSDLSRTEISDRVDEIAEMMDISELLDDRPGQLSGGQRQRVALGRAIIRQPRAFLFDEPLSNLDAKLRTHMRTEIAQLQQDLDVTSIYVTHDQAEAMTMGDRIAILNEGDLQQVGRPTEVYRHPVNRFVAGFIGSPSMNFINVTAEQINNGLDLRLSNGQFVHHLDSSMTDRLDVSGGNRLVLGVRPEDIGVEVDSCDEMSRLSGVVNIVETMGSDNYLKLSVGKREWFVRVLPTLKPSPGSEIQLSFDDSSVHIFDSQGNSLKTQGTDDDAFPAADVSPAKILSG